MRDDDLGFAVSQHLAHFPDGFFARLGPKFLEEYYRTFLTSPDACALVAEDPHGTVAYIAGVLRPGPHRSHVLDTHRWTLIRLATRSLTRRPRLLQLFLRTRSRVYARKLVPRNRDASLHATVQIPAVLSHLVVDPSRQCQGIGRGLILGLSEAARRAGCNQMVLVTEKGAPSESYYRHLQWTETGTHRTLDGKPVTSFRIDLAGSLDRGVADHGQPGPKEKR